MGDKENLHDMVVTIRGKVTVDDTTPLPQFEKLAATIHFIAPKAASTGDRAAFCFKLKGDYEGRTAWGSVPVRKEFTEDADLYKWISNILGKPLDIGAQFKLGDLVGKDVLIVIKNSDKKDENGNYYQNVVEVLKDPSAKEEEKAKSEPKQEPKKDIPVKDVSDVLEEETVSEPKEADTGSSAPISDDELPF